MEPSLTAIHESGHAVVARSLGFHGVRASIKPGEDTLGRIFHDSRSRRIESVQGTVCDIPGFAEDIQNEIVVCFAGYAAEVRLAPESEQHAKLGSADDNLQAAKLLEDLADPDETPFRDQARNMVTEHWRAIVLVALELDRWTTLSEDELDCLIELTEGDDIGNAIRSLIGCRQSTSQIGLSQTAFEKEDNRLQQLVCDVRERDN